MRSAYIKKGRNHVFMLQELDPTTGKCSFLPLNYVWGKSKFTYSRLSDFENRLKRIYKDVKERWGQPDRINLMYAVKQYANGAQERIPLSEFITLKKGW